MSSQDVSSTLSSESAPTSSADDRLARIRTACLVMHEAGGPLPTAELVQRTRISERQLQRDFQDVIGVTPRTYGQQVRAAAARSVLNPQVRVTDAIYQAGFGSVRAFYQQVATRLGMTPLEYVSGAPDIELLWGVRASAVGSVLAVASARGLCAARIAEQPALLADLEAEVQAEFPKARLVRDDSAMSDVLAALVALAEGHPAPQLPLHVQATAFQARVWQALQLIPAGETRSYSELAAELGDPKSVRAVARACATNPVALVVPCHRVIRSDGDLAGYRWGLQVKHELLSRENAPVAPTLL